MAAAARELAACASCRKSGVAGDTIRAPCSEPALLVEAAAGGGRRGGQCRAEVLGEEPLSLGGRVQADGLLELVGRRPPAWQPKANIGAVSACTLGGGGLVMPIILIGLSGRCCPGAGSRSHLSHALAEAVLPGLADHCLMQLVLLALPCF